MIRLRAVAVFAAFLAVSPSAFAGDNWMGTWVLNPAASKYSPGPAPKSMTLRYEAAPGGGVRLSSDSVNAEGKASHTEYVSHFDGKDVPWKGNPNADTTIATRVDQNSYDNVWKKDGKVTISAPERVRTQSPRGGR